LYKRQSPPTILFTTTLTQTIALYEIFLKIKVSAVMFFMMYRKLLACDSDGLSDPYVRAYLLPDKSRSGRRRTDVKKNTLEPVWDDT